MNFKRPLYIFILLFFSFPITSFAEKNLPPSHLNNNKSEASFYLGLSSTYFDYKETLPPPLKSTEKGFIYGTIFGVTYNKNKLHIDGKLHFGMGNTKYDGTTQAGVPLKDTTYNTILGFDFHIGKRISIENSLILIPYTGYGYYQWNRDLGFLEVYSWFNLPLGLKVEKTFNDQFKATLDVSYRKMYFGKIKVYLSDINKGYNDPDADLGNKGGIYINLPLEYKLSKDMSFITSAYYESSSIGQSETFTIKFNGVPTGRGYEPASKTKKAGLSLLLKMNF